MRWDRFIVASDRFGSAVKVPREPQRLEFLSSVIVFSDPKNF
jgi:hypothetical protein